MCEARAYRNFSSIRETQMSKGFRRTPISMANSGQRSRISSRKGRRRRNAMIQAESAWKMGGEVPITRSACPTLRPVNKDEQTKVRKEKTRHMKLRFKAGDRRV